MVRGNVTLLGMPASDPGDPRGWLCVGAGGHARSVVDTIERSGQRVHAVHGAAVGGWHVPVIGDEGEAREQATKHGLRVVVAVGDNATRLRLVQTWAEYQSSVVAVTASVSQRARLDRASVVLEQAHVGPGAELLDATLVNTGAVVEHDTRIGRAVHLGPGSVVLGGAVVGDRTFIGALAVVLPGVVVGDDCVVGAGAVVTVDVPAGARVVGVPAHEIRR